MAPRKCLSIVCTNKKYLRGNALQCKIIMSEMSYPCEVQVMNVPMLDTIIIYIVIKDVVVIYCVQLVDEIDFFEVEVKLVKFTELSILTS